MCSEAFLHHKSNDVDLLDLSVFLSSTQPTPQSGSKVRSGDITTRPSLLTSSVSAVMKHMIGFSVLSHVLSILHTVSQHLRQISEKMFVIWVHWPFKVTKKY